MTTNDEEIYEDMDHYEELIRSPGGYTNDFVDGKPPDQYICLICTLTAKEAYQVTCCGKIYCKGCLDKLSRSHKSFKCLNCQNSLTNNYFKDVKTNSEIEQLEVYCNNKNSGCMWKGQLVAIGTHLQICLHQVVSCPNRCKEEVLRSHLADHLNSQCPKRDYECPYCSEMSTYQNITVDHMKKCYNSLQQCPNEGCDESIAKKIMESHLLVCPMGVVSCPYSDIGCRSKVTRGELTQHKQKRMDDHLALAVEMIKTLQAYSYERLTAVEQTTKILPRVFKFTSFTKYKEMKECRYSSSFYTSIGGYKMCLNVDANGCSDGKGEYISCFICILPGEYDDIIEWPFQGEITIELLNQMEDKYHWKQAIRFDSITPEKYCKRNADESRNGWGKHFISHSEVDRRFSNNLQYLKDDSLYFRVSVKLRSKTKSWLV